MSTPHMPFLHSPSHCVCAPWSLGTSSSVPMTVQGLAFSCSSVLPCPVTLHGGVRAPQLGQWEHVSPWMCDPSRHKENPEDGPPWMWPGAPLAPVDRSFAESDPAWRATVGQTLAPWAALEP